MTKELIKQVNTEKAPAALGPYSQAKIVGNMVYLSGQIAIDPETKKIVDGNVIDHTKQIMSNLIAVLRAAGTELKYVMKTTIFLVDMDDFKEVNEIYGSYFKNMIPPARSTVQVAKLPLGVPIEIDMIATIPKK